MTLRPFKISELQQSMRKQSSSFVSPGEHSGGEAEAEPVVSGCYGQQRNGQSGSGHVSEFITLRTRV